MPVSLDNVATGQLSGISTGGSGTSLTYSGMTVGTGTDRALIVQIASENSTAGFATTSVSWGAQAMSLISGFTLNNYRVELWGLVNPVSGNQTITITLPNNWNYWGVSAISFNGVDQVNPFYGAISGGNYGGGVAHVGPITSSANDAAVDVVMAAGQTVSSPSQTQAFNIGSGVGAAGSYELGQSSPSFGWTIGAPGYWAETATALLFSGMSPPPPPPPPPPPLPPPFVLPPSPSQARVLLQADAHFYFNGVTGNDTTGDGSTSKPFATPVAIYSLAQATLDAGAYVIHAISQVPCPSINWTFRGPPPPSANGISSAGAAAGIKGLGSFIVESPAGQGSIILDAGAQVTFNNSNLQAAAGTGAEIFVTASGGSCWNVTGTTTLTTAAGANNVMHTADGLGISSGIITVVNGGSMLGLFNAESGSKIVSSAHWIFTGGNPFTQFCGQADLGGGIDLAAATQTGYSGPPSRVAGGGGWLNLGGGFI